MAVVLEAKGSAWKGSWPLKGSTPPAPPPAPPPPVVLLAWVVGMELAEELLEMRAELVAEKGSPPPPPPLLLNRSSPVAGAGTPDRDDCMGISRERSLHDIERPVEWNSSVTATIGEGSFVEGWPNYLGEFTIL